MTPPIAKIYPGQRVKGCDRLVQQQQLWGVTLRPGVTAFGLFTALAPLVFNAGT